MAVSSSALLLSAKGAAMSAALLSVTAALVLKLSAPSISELANVQIPLLWLSLLSWLEPPYIYLVINGIIFTIAASSKLHGNRPQEEHEEAPVISAVESPGGPGDVFALPHDGIFFSPRESVVYDESGAAGISEVECAEQLVAEGGDGQKDRVEEEEKEFVISRSAWTPAARRTSLPEISAAERLPAPEKPLVSSRFVHQRPSKASPEALGVIKPKRQETLENTWKAITDGRAVPLARRSLRKTETCENRGPPIDPLEHPGPGMRKSRTFQDRTNQLTSPPSPSPEKARKEASPSQDELNRRVEAFIRKFNQEMRLQRQESLNQYNAMTNRGS